MEQRTIVLHCTQKKVQYKQTGLFFGYTHLPTPTFHFEKQVIFFFVKFLKTSIWLKNLFFFFFFF